MPLRRHYPCLDQITIAVAAIRGGNFEVAEEALSLAATDPDIDDAVTDLDELQQLALEEGLDPEESDEEEDLDPDVEGDELPGDEDDEIEEGAAQTPAPVAPIPEADTDFQARLRERVEANLRSI